MCAASILRAERTIVFLCRIPNQRAWTLFWPFNMLDLTPVTRHDRTTERTKVRCSAGCFSSKVYIRVREVRRTSKWTGTVHQPDVDKKRRRVESTWDGGQWEWTRSGPRPPARGDYSNDLCWRCHRPTATVRGHAANYTLQINPVTLNILMLFRKIRHIILLYN